MLADGPKQLNWEWEELVLACDLVMQNDGRYVDDRDQRAIELSQVELKWSAPGRDSHVGGCRRLLQQHSLPHGRDGIQAYARWAIEKASAALAGVRQLLTSPPAEQAD